jgi:hypothetical protein
MGQGYHPLTNDDVLTSSEEMMAEELEIANHVLESI